MLLRPTTDADLDAVTAFTVDDPVGWIDADRYRAELAERMYRPEWTWVAEDDDGRIVARALWWGRADSDHPLALDCLHVAAGDRAERVALAAELLRVGHRGVVGDAAPLPQYLLSVDPEQRTAPEVVDSVEWRAEAALAAGLTERVERLRLEWTPECGLPAAPHRLTFHEADDDAFLAVFQQIAVGSLDAETRRNLATQGPEATARHELKFYLDCPGERDWWRIARDETGAVAGFVIPSATPYSPNVGYLGVVPELRGRGLVDELLAEATRAHAGRDAERITATTDTANAPMAAGFARAGYRTTQIRLVFSTLSA